MALFRDMDGNFFRIPSEILEAYRVEGELPEGSTLAGEEVSGGLQTCAGTPGYIWPSPADVIPAEAPSYLWPAAHAAQVVPRALPTPAPSYIWPSAVTH
ncbi:MAG TPA: hypothetical protein VF297_29155 [Pyrinomonadaceae bacterium]